MAYERLNLKTGQVITEEVFAHLEDGIEGAANAVLMTPILYADLVALRDAGKLKAGMFYRITDYEATSSDNNTLCPNSLPFDVVVQAVSDRCLSVDAIGLTKTTEILRLDYYLTPKEGPFFDWWLPEGKLSYKLTKVNDDVDPGLFMSAIQSFDNFSGELQINGDMVIGENNVYYVTEDGTFYTKTDSAYFGKGIPVSSKGLVARLRDAHENDFPYDFRNIIVKNMIGEDDLTVLPSGNAGIYPNSITTGHVRNVVVEPYFSKDSFEIPKVRIMPYSVRNVHVGKNCSHIYVLLADTTYFPLISVGEGCSDIKVGCSVGSFCGRLRLYGSYTTCKVGNFVNGLHIQGYFVNLKLNDGCGCFKSRDFCTISCDYTTSSSTRIHDVTLDGPFEVESYSIKKSPSISNSHTTIAADSNGVIKEFNLADLAN